MEENYKVKFWKNKKTSVWFGDQEEKILREFRLNFLKFHYSQGNLYHITLKIDYDETSSPKAIDDKLSNEFKKYIYNLKRGKEKVKIKAYQAIKEFNGPVKGQKYQCPHLHLVLEIEYRSKADAYSIFKQKWKHGICDVQIIRSLDHLYKLSGYLTNKNNKKDQMTLPPEYMKLKKITRTYFSRGFKELKTGINFRKFVVFQNEISENHRHLMIKEFKKTKREQEEYFGPSKYKKRVNKTRKPYSSTRSYDEILNQDIISGYAKINEEIKTFRLNISPDDLKKFNYTFNNIDKSYNFEITDEEFLELMNYKI